MLENGRQHVRADALRPARELEIKRDTISIGARRKYVGRALLMFFFQQANLHLNSTKTLNRQMGRPRSEKTRQAILRTAINLLNEQQLRDISIENIAKHAGAGKATIYRWWPDKIHLFIDAFLEFMAPKTSRHKEPGAKLSDLIDHFNAVLDEYNGGSGGIISQIIAECQYNPDARIYLLEKIIGPRRQFTSEIVDQAKARNEIKCDADTDILIDMLFGPIYFRMLVGHQPLDDAFAQAITGQFSKLVNCEEAPNPPPRRAVRKTESQSLP